MSSGWYTPKQKDWEHMTIGEKIAMLVVCPPMLIGFIYIMCNMFYWVGILIWEIIKGVF